MVATPTYGYPEAVTEVRIRALEQNASAVVAEAAAGEPTTITDRGGPVAPLSPIPSTRLEAILVAGVGRSARRSISELPAPAPGPNISSALAAMRADERY